MSVDTHIRRGHPIVFGLIIFFALVEICVSAWLTSRFNTRHNQSSGTEKDRTIFTLFTSAWTFIFGGLYFALFLHSPVGSIATSVASHGIFLILTWIFWTAAAASVTQMLGGGLNCKTQQVFVYCGQLNALEAFAWIEWVLVSIALIVVLLRGISASRRGDGFQGGLVV